MIGVIVKECKSSKVKGLTRLINTIGKDSVSVKNFKIINFEKTDFIVQNGIKKKKRSSNQIYEQVEQISHSKKIPVLIRELPVIRQVSLGNTKKSCSFDDRWIRFSWNSFYMDEGMHPYDASYNRWDDLQKKHNLTINDWKSRGDYILLCLQLDGDSALNKLIYNDINYTQYLENIILKIRTLSDRPILVRGHPRSTGPVRYLKSKFSNDSIKFSNYKNLYDDLDRAYCMVTYNSTSCVESTLHGIPTITLDSSAIAYPVSNKLNDIENLKEFDRTEWCKQIAFMQWQGKELHDGYVWNLLKSVMPKQGINLS